MDEKNFIEKFASIFDAVDASTLTAGTIFRDIEEWNSMNALVLLAMVEEEYGVQLNNQDIRNSNTIFDLYTVVSNKKA